jgi:hypothetical protein
MQFLMGTNYYSVKKGVEKHARENNVQTITVELMEELRKKRFGNDAPVFKF